MSWPKLWAIARLDIGLSEREWQSLWVDEFTALFVRWREICSGEDARLAIAVAQLAQTQTTERVSVQPIFEQIAKTRRFQKED